MAEKPKARGIAWLELVMAVAIVAVALVIIILVIKPAQIAEKSRDSERVLDLTSIGSAINLYLADNHNFNGLSAGVIYDSTQGTSSTREKINGTGWIPIDFNLISSGSPLSSLPVDPTNNKSKNLYYRFGVDPKTKTYELDCAFESSDYITKESSDGGNNSSLYEYGTNLTILP